MQVHPSLPSLGWVPDCWAVPTCWRSTCTHCALSGCQRSHQLDLESKNGSFSGIILVSCNLAMACIQCECRTGHSYTRGSLRRKQFTAGRVNPPSLNQEQTFASLNSGSKTCCGRALMILNRVIAYEGDMCLGTNNHSVYFNN